MVVPGIRASHRSVAGVLVRTVAIGHAVEWAATRVLSRPHSHNRQGTLLPTLVAVSAVSKHHVLVIADTSDPPNGLNMLEASEITVPIIDAM
jgi:hypothetical protein